MRTNSKKIRVQDQIVWVVVERFGLTAILIDNWQPKHRLPVVYTTA